MYIVNSRYVAQHCSLTKPQPGNDLITAVWLVNGGLLNWASIAFFTRHVFSMLPLRHTLYNLSNGSQRMVSILCWCQLCTFCSNHSEMSLPQLVSSIRMNIWDGEPDQPKRENKQTIPAKHKHHTQMHCTQICRIFFQQDSNLYLFFISVCSDRAYIYRVELGPVQIFQLFSMIC